MAGGGIYKQTLAAVACAMALVACAPRAPDLCEGAAVHVVPNTHGTATGWLTGFGRERNYMVNNYADHIAYARRNEDYTLAFSEVPTAIAMQEIAPETFRDLRRAVREGDADLANAFYLETSPDLTQGETLLRMGVESIRWQDEHLGRRPDTAWLIDATGIHRQIPEILAQLGVRQFVYGRNPPLRSNIHLWRSPSGREALAVYSDSYAHWRALYGRSASANPSALPAAQAELERYRAATPAEAPSLWLVGAADYSPAPREDGAVEAAMEAVAQTPIGRPCFSTPTRFFSTAWQAQQRAPGAFPVYEGESLNSYNLFWFLNPRFKQQYRAAESRLLALESLAALRSLDGTFVYPSEPLQRAWTLLFLNSDRALLWGAGAGDPYYGADTWSAADRFDTLDSILDRIEADLGGDAANALAHPAGGAGVALVEAPYANGAGIAGATCDRMGNTRATCLVRFGPGQTAALTQASAAPLQDIAPPAEVMSGGVSVRFDPRTGDLVGLVANGANALGGASNFVVIERQPPHSLHQDYLSPPAMRTEIAVRDGAQQVRAWRSPLRTIVESEETMGGGRVAVVRRVSVLHDTLHIDVDLTLRGVPDDSIAYVRFQLGGEAVRELRGVPYGFVARDLRTPTPYDDRFLMHDHQTLGLHDTIAPALRWSAHTDERGLGVALFDYGSPGRETYRNQSRLMLLAASTHYRGLPNAWLDASGETRFRYTIAPVFSADPAALARTARDLGAPVVRMSAAAMPPIAASDNFVIESVRRQERWLEIRGVDVGGAAGYAEISAPWRHTRAERVNALGETQERLTPSGDGAERRYRFAVRPQEIVTLRFRLDSAVAAAPPLARYRDLAPPRAAADLALRDPTLIGHPPQ